MPKGTKGNVVQVIGTVVDVEFPAEGLKACPISTTPSN